MEDTFDNKSTTTAVSSWLTFWTRQIRHGSVLSTVRLLLHPLNNEQRRVLSTRCNFWTSRTAHGVYTIILVAAVTQQYRFLYAIPLILILQLATVLLKWLVYIIDDPQLFAAISFLSTWFQRFLKEGEQILTGASGTKLVFAGVVAYNAQTGMGYLRAILRYKMSIINQAKLEELDERRFVTGRNMISSMKNVVKRKRS